MSYKYKKIQVPDNTKNVPGYLEEVANQEAASGWEFYRIDSISTAHRPGCIGGLLGQSVTYTQDDIATFKKNIKINNLL